MKRIRLMGLALLALFALGILVASSASAELPEILPVPTVEKPAKFTSEAGEVELETTVGTRVTCKKAKNKGEFDTQDEGFVLVDFEGCKDEGANCNSPGDAAGVILTFGNMEAVDILPGGVLRLGLWIEPEEEEKIADLTFTCGVVKVTMLGSVIGAVENAAGGTLLDLEKFKELKVLWKRTTLGEQEIKECMTLIVLCKKGPFELRATFGLGEELAALVADATVKFEKEYEVHF